MLPIPSALYREVKLPPAREAHCLHLRTNYADSMSITLDLPPDISETEARRELAIALYRVGKLPPGRAAQLAGMDRWDFDALLFERKVPFPMDEAEVLEEVRNALRRS